MGWSFTDAITNQVNTQELLKTYEQLKEDLAKNDTAAVLSDYKALGGGEKPSSIYLTQALDSVSTAFDEWTRSVNIGGNILNNTGTGDGAQGSLGGQLVNEAGNPITLYDYLHNTNPGQKCKMTLPEFDYKSGGGTLTIDGKTIQMYALIRDDDFFGDLNNSFNGAFHWTDDPNIGSGRYIITAEGSLSDFLKNSTLTFKTNTPSYSSASAALNETFKNLGL